MLRVLLCIFQIAWAHAADPFWKSKERVFERIQNGEVIVVVAKEKGVTAKHRLRINGGGWTAAPRDFVFKKSLAFEDLAKVSGYIKSASYDASKQKLDLKIGAFGHETQMRLALKIREESEPKRIEYLVEDGPLKGLVGAFNYVEAGKSGAQTEVGIEGDFHYDKLPIPTFFVEFGMEVVFQRMAINLRKHVETEFRKVKP